ncbi:MAG: hypothetical protein M1827_003921 [Pycnora praestabilis]|nr:MAG: hypothetical protein M1827_003921 [Pycnora praestabilis]
METVATLNRISRERLSSLLLNQQKSSPSQSPIAIIDVRDDDHVGGHIAGSTHVPSSTLDYRTAELVRTLKPKSIVVFHCALSQQRGPSAALRYQRERKRLLGDDAGASKAAKEEPKIAREGMVMGEEGMNFEKVSGSVEKGEVTEEGKVQGQEVYVLDGGFVKWQEKYGEDERLTKAYSKEIWQDDY